MVANKNRKQVTNIKKNNKSKPKLVSEKEKIIEKVVEDSDDDIEEEEMLKMLGTSDNSDIDSDEFSVEENIEVKESKVNRKRKLSISDDENNCKKSKAVSLEDSAEIDDSENEDDECGDSDCEDDSEFDDFINDEDDKEEEEESEAVETAKETKETPKSEKKQKTPEEKTSKKENTEDSEATAVKKVAKLEKKQRIIKEEKAKSAETAVNIKDIFEDTPNVESENLRKEIHNKLITRMNNTVVINNLPNKFTFQDAKTLIPEMVSCILPYNFYLHKIVGTIYVDVATPEEAAKIAKKLNNSELKSRKIFAIVQSKIVDDVDKYNCQRLVIANVHYKTTVDDIKRLLPKALRVEMLPVKNIDRKVSRTAFAHYSCVEDALNDYDSKHGFLINECPINLKFQIRKDDNIKTKQSKFDKKKLTVMGLKKNTSMDELKKAFPQAVSIRPALDKAFATISYNSEAECDVDRKKRFENKQNKWRINFSILHNANGKESEVKVKDKKKFDGKKFEGKKFEGKKSEGKKTRRKVKNEKNQIQTSISNSVLSEKGSGLARKHRRKLKKRQKKMEHREKAIMKDRQSIK